MGKLPETSNLDNPSRMPGLPHHPEKPLRPAHIKLQTIHSTRNNPMPVPELQPAHQRNRNTTHVKIDDMTINQLQRLEACIKGMAPGVAAEWLIYLTGGNLHWSTLTIELEAQERNSGIKPPRFYEIP
jgi:hypothetical protein